VFAAVLTEETCAWLGFEHGVGRTVRREWCGARGLLGTNTIAWLDFEQGVGRTIRPKGRGIAALPGANTSPWLDFELDEDHAAAWACGGPLKPDGVTGGVEVGTTADALRMVLCTSSHDMPSGMVRSRNTRSRAETSPS